MGVLTDSRTHGQLLLGGDWQDGGAGEAEVLNPATEEVVGTIAEATLDQVRLAAKAARSAQPAWATTSPAERAEILATVGQLIRLHERELSELTMTETGFVRATAEGLVLRSAMMFEFAARECVKDFSIATEPMTLPTPDGRKLVNGIVQRRPVGVVACIVPFNGPIFGAAMKLSHAVAMGNTVVVKPAPQNPLAVVSLFGLLQEGGLPDGVANLITALDPAAGAELVASPDVDMVSFTGSSTVGQRIYADGARTMKRLLLECGGKGACIVCDDADIDLAAQALSTVWTVNCGQVCAAPTRAIVQRGIYDQLIERLATVAATVKVGLPSESDTVAGPVISAAQRARIEGFVEGAVSEGATLVTGGQRPDLPKGFFVAPTLLSDCHNEMQAARQEIFGPVVTVIPFDTDAGAVAIANDSDYGLVDYLFSADRARAYRMASQLQAGTIQVNTIATKPDMPRGGWKHSGIGREGGTFGLLSYTEPAGVVWA